MVTADDLVGLEKVKKTNVIQTLSFYLGQMEQPQRKVWKTAECKQDGKPIQWTCGDGMVYYIDLTTLDMVASWSITMAIIENYKINKECIL